MIATSSFRNTLRSHPPPSHPSRSRKIPIIFIDTGYLFAETYRYAPPTHRATSSSTCIATPPPSHQPTKRRSMGAAGNTGPDGMDALPGAQQARPHAPSARQHSSPTDLALRPEAQANRTHEPKRPILERQAERLKLFPIIDWSDEQVNAYLRSSITSLGIRSKPMATLSTGDWHSTTKLGSRTCDLRTHASEGYSANVAYTTTASGRKASNESVRKSQSVGPLPPLPRRHRGTIPPASRKALHSQASRFMPKPTATRSRNGSIRASTSAT